MNHLLRAQCRNVIKRNINRSVYFTTISGIRQEERLPWFVDPDFAAKKVPSESLLEHQPIPGPSRTVGTKIKPLPPGVPSLISELYYELAKSPLLEPGSLEVRNPLPSMPGPPLPKSFPKGRRRRGGTDFGEGIPDPEGGLWKWIVLAQVKEGTEARGSIESILRIVRKMLLTSNNPVSLPPNRKKAIEDAWGMLDAGEFAVHILGRNARENYFPDTAARTWQW